MNRTAIEYVLNPDGTPGFNWGIITGCLHPCRELYCYNTMKHTSPLNRFYKKNREKETGEMRFATPDKGLWPYGFDPTYYPYRLEEPMCRKKPATIFVANGGDLFGEWVDDYIINCVLTVIWDCPQHTFILLTKNFDRLLKFEFPDNCWVGYSKPRSDLLDNFEQKAFIDMQWIQAKTKFVSFEPLHGGFAFDDKNVPDCYRRIDLKGVSWVVIGRESGPRAEQRKPKRDWIMTIVKSAQDQKIPIWMKNNLAPEVMHKCNLIQELPQHHNSPVKMRMPSSNSRVYFR